ncbi:uncharacterized protein N7483_001896 [Penicillium malachiteum]|uniref:uncharacterized protein n=1 Tax=Penicillium malachiteum TaxID=1324776 RepID=UPI002549A06C|nr:uncharacterized protein N7483_001896 [Penicillium malachiteum]KAJ5736771.1 hypothetical protein N7483_001896 [Penicillium malachiteum]
MLTAFNPTITTRRLRLFEQAQITIYLPSWKSLPFCEHSCFPNSDSLVDSIEGLNLADTITGPSGSASRCSSPAQQAVIETIQELITSLEATLAHAQQAENAIEETHTPSGQGIVKLSSLKRRITALAKTTKIISNATEHYILDYITSLAGSGTLLQNILPRYTNELECIARNVLDSTGDDNNVLRETLEMCYDQALCTSGTLHLDNHFISLGEASLEWPYNPDFESDDYYDHENRLDIDDRYAEAFLAQCERESKLNKRERERQENEEWIRFWVRALGQCPDGPTLFYSPASQLPDSESAVPRYLFRAFDKESSGRSDHSIVASAESISAIACRSKVDILSRPSEEIIQMLYRHLTKSCFGRGENTDNLMSWSSSLLFVIQYAVWRCYQLKCDPAEVQICTIDTRKFPPGQFVRDMSLIRAHREAPNLHREMRSFFEFRLKNSYYDNGEYLSQGVLHHAGRSMVECLAQLIQTGLYDLYPEFADVAEKNSWTKRVGFLRTAWSVEQTTTRLDIKSAVEIARACFKGLDTPDIAILLLSFKARKLRVPAKEATSFPNTPLVKVAEQGLSRGYRFQRNYNEYGPDEVRRYMTNADKMVPIGRDGFIHFGWSTVYCQLLEGVFECS